MIADVSWKDTDLHQYISKAVSSNMVLGNTITAMDETAIWFD